MLTTPMRGSFKAFAARAGVAADELRAAFAAVFARAGAPPFFELECGRMAEAQFLASLEQMLGEQLGREVSCAGFSETMWARIEPNEPMAALRAEGYRMALVTNNVHEWESRWRAMAPIDDIFELVVDSTYVGMRKPDPEIYDLTVRLGVPAQACLFVDDLRTQLRRRPRRGDAGMRAIVYRDTDQATADIRAALDGGG